MDAKPIQAIMEGSCPSIPSTHEATMPLPRRQFLRLAAGTAALPALPRLARAQTYPSRPVRWLVGFAAGGPQDIVAPPLGQALSDRLSHQFVIADRPGARGNTRPQPHVPSPR